MIDKIDTPMDQEKWGARRRAWRRYRELLAGDGPPGMSGGHPHVEALYNNKRYVPDDPYEEEDDDGLELIAETVKCLRALRALMELATAQLQKEFDETPWSALKAAAKASTPSCGTSWMTAHAVDTGHWQSLKNVPHTATHEAIERVHRGADPPNHGGGSAQHRP